MYKSRKWMPNKTKHILLLIFLLFFTIPPNSHAYLDPGTGSYIYQFVLAIIVGGLYTLRLQWDKVKEFFARFFSNNKPDQH